ncbi:MAG: family 43 glycosylhydrolase [Pseudarcicella sp.]|nr:family 43 glycosylhydrolase [Pseudarcicella sp.]
MKKNTIILLLFTLIANVSIAQKKPKVWIYTDMSDKNIKGQEKEGSANDPDDISAMAGYLIMANEFDTKGIVVASTHRKEHKISANQADWANSFFGEAYKKDVQQLNLKLKGYPEEIKFTQSCIKESAERFVATENYTSLASYGTVKSLIDLVESGKDTINVLIWGSTTEPAILVKHCMATGKEKVLKKIKFISHWTSSNWHQGNLEHPENVANCREDAQACAYLKQMASTGKIIYYECGAIGQHGIVSGSQKGLEYYNKFKTSELGKIFAEGKFVFNSVDHSDAATYWVLIGKWGVSLSDIKKDGTNPPELEKENENKFDKWSHRIHDELLRRSILVGGEIKPSTPPETFKNPIMSGFNPDPSVCRVGDDYYMVTSSFEFYPGIPIYKSRDLVNWNLIGYGLNRPNQVELPKGLADSRGIYAVTIRHHQGVFYLITTCVSCKDNFYITATDPAGPWSEPVWLNSPGIDPSLFFDEDGKCYYTGCANISGKKDWPNQNGAYIQELDLKAKKLVGERKQLTHGHAANARWTEGPHLYKINGKYLLLVAEGGTGAHHAVTVFHSDNVFGPYIPEHTNPVLTHRNLGKDYPIHSVGHAELFQLTNGDWWAVALGKRKKDGKTMLGRETFLTPVAFEGNTPVFNPGIGKVEPVTKRPNLPWSPFPKTEIRDNFEGQSLNLNWNFLRTPYQKWYDLKDNKLSINLRPEVADSLVNPSMIIRRIKNQDFYAATKLIFKSNAENEIAGLTIYRASANYYQLVKTPSAIKLIKRKGSTKEVVAEVEYKNQDVHLSVKAKDGKLFFMYGEKEWSMKAIAVPQDFAVVSDEATLGGFTGPFVGVYTSSNGLVSQNSAIFDWFDYEDILN